MTDTVRQHARKGQPLDGADAKALEHALTITEGERDEYGATLEWTSRVLDGEEVNDLALSFEVVRRVRDLMQSNAAYAETIVRLQDGKPAPHYCAWCMTEIKQGGDPDHMLACEKAPFQRLTQQVLDAEADRDRLSSMLQEALAVGLDMADLISTACPDADVWTDGLAERYDKLEASATPALTDTPPEPQQCAGCVEKAEALREAWGMFQDSGVMREPTGRTGNRALNNLGSHLDQWSSGDALADTPPGGDKRL